MIPALVILAGVAVLFVAGACRLSGLADDATEKAFRDRADGDWPHIPTIDRPQGD